jgi:hypothetical protein
MRTILLLAILLPVIVSAQTATDVVEHYRNGNVRFKSHSINDSTLVYVEYFRNGNTKDSVMLKKELPFGTRAMYYKNGEERYVITYQNGPGENTFKRSRRNRSLKSTGGNLDFKSFGPHYQYNRKGIAIRYQDMNKGNSVKVPAQYRDHQHLAGKSVGKRFIATKASLTNASKSTTIKSGAIISLQLKGETNITHHYQVEGFSKDSLLVSKFRYDLSRSRNTLAFDSNDILGFNEIEAIYFGRNKNNTAEVVALAVTTVGFILFFEPILIVPIFQGFGALAEPAALAMMGSGIPIMFWGRHLYKQIVPREHKLSEWKINVKGL